MICTRRRELLQKGARTAVALTIGSALGPVAHGSTRSTGAMIEEFLNYPGNFSIGAVELLHLEKLREVYSARNYKPLWSINGTATSTSMELTRKLLNSHLLGLDPTKYYGRLLYQLATNRDATQFLKFELLLTDTLHTFFDDLAHGALVQPGRKAGWRLQKSKLDVTGITNDFFRGEFSYRRTLERLQPTHPQYRNLINSLEYHQSMLAQGGWQHVPAGRPLKYGQISPRITHLRQRLFASGDLNYVTPTGQNIFDDVIQAGVTTFQKRHGLHEDGVVGPKTLAEINVPLERRIAQLQTNIDRWRWMPRDLGDSNIMVNTAGYDLDVNINGATAATMKVVVGKVENRTTLFSDTMKHLVFNPSWYVPKSIVRELLPNELARPGWFRRNNFEITSQSSGAAVTADNIRQSPDAFTSNYQVRQRPGKKNALGKIKFMFPNKYNIYLHDTNAKSLFARSKRAFSHGCIRLEQPEALARVLLQADGRTDTEIDSYLIYDQTKKVVLRTPVPVHITYQTSWVDQSGRTHFREDIYQHDEHAKKQLRQAREFYAEVEMKALAATGLTVVANTY